MFPEGSETLKSFKGIYIIYVPERGFRKYGYYISRKSSF
jgi:hypothetical protein